MPTKDQLAQFSADLKQRFEEVVTWAVSQPPGSGPVLSRADFDACRKEMAKIAERDMDIGERNAAIPEPSEAGPQYVSVSPAPWP